MVLCQRHKIGNHRHVATKSVGVKVVEVHGLMAAWSAWGTKWHVTGIVHGSTKPMIEDG